MRTWLSALVGLTLLGATVSCAPRNTKTHFERWAEETEKRKIEEAKAEEAEKEATAEGKTGPKTVGPGAAPPPPPPAAPPPDYSSLPPGETPGITRTSTSRVIRPEPEEEDVIY